MAEGFHVPRVEPPSSGWLPGPWGMCRTIRGTGERGGQAYSRRACRRSTVASLLRGYIRPSRWGYCADHLALYGRVVRDGEVWWDPDAAKAVLQATGQRSW